MSTEEYGPPRQTPGWQKALFIVAGVVVVLVVLRSAGGLSGLLSAGDCATHLEYPVPAQRLKGIKDAKLIAERCQGDSDTGRAKSYVLLSVDVNGETSGNSKVRALRTSVRLDRRPSAGGQWERNIAPTDIPTDSGVSIDGSKVAYAKQWRWNMPRSKSRIKVALVLRTSKGKPARMVHTFSLP